LLTASAQLPAIKQQDVCENTGRVLSGRGHQFGKHQHADILFGTQRSDHPDPYPDNMLIQYTCVILWELTVKMITVQHTMLKFLNKNIHLIFKQYLVSVPYVPVVACKRCKHLSGVGCTCEEPELLGFSNEKFEDRS